MRAAAEAGAARQTAAQIAQNAEETVFIVHYSLASWCVNIILNPKSTFEQKRMVKSGKAERAADGAAFRHRGAAGPRLSVAEPATAKKRM